jgi:serine/threonine protein kinase
MFSANLTCALTPLWQVTGQRLPYGALCDEWSIGVCVYMMLSGSPPFPSPSATLTGEFQMRVLRGRLEFPEREWASISTTAKAFVSALLTVDPGQRATCARALAHPWLAGVTMQSVLGRSPTIAGASDAVHAHAGGAAGPAGSGAAGGAGAGSRMALTMEDNNLFRRRTQRRAATIVPATPALGDDDENGHATPLAVPPLRTSSPPTDRSRSASRAASPQPCVQAFRTMDLALTLSCSAPAILHDAAAGLNIADVTLVRGEESADESDDSADEAEMRSCSTPTPLGHMD